MVGIQPREGQDFTIYTSHVVKAGTLTLVEPTEKSLLAAKNDQHEELVTFAEVATETVFEKRDRFGEELHQEREEGCDEN